MTAQRQHGQPMTITPRHRRILLALLVRQQTREEIDRIAGASNGPDEVQRIRQKFALSIPCQRQKSRDRDGHPVQVGIYRLTDADRTTARRVLAIAKDQP
jgi:hypothetical protein